jgi:hypothetical protein
MTSQPADRLHPRRNPEQRDWHDFLNPIEAVEVAALEANAKDLHEKRKRLSHELLLHRQRCMSRRKEAMLRDARTPAVKAEVAQ